MKWDNAKGFPCPGREEYSLGIGEKYYKKRAFTNGEIMHAAAAMDRKYRKSVFLKIPLDYNIEYKDFGGQVKWNGERYIGAGYVYKEIEEIDNILDIQYQVGSFALIFDCLSHCPVGEEVLLGVEGPFSVLCSLIDPMTVLRNLRKKKELILKVLFHIADILAEYMKDSIQLGAVVISYADPIGTIEFLGKKNYRDFNGIVTAYLMKCLKPWLDTACIHFCGKCSTALEQTGFVAAWPVAAEGAYGQEVLYYSQKKEIQFLGHGCIQCENRLVRRIWAMKFVGDD